VGRVCKILAANKRLNLFRSFHEVEILKHLNHPNIVQIIEYFSQHEFLYIMLEDIPGRTLHELYLHDDLGSLPAILEVLRQLLIALNFCHANGYAHRAVHPEHVMLVRLERRRVLVKLIGFGQALKIGAPKFEQTGPRDALFAGPEADAHPEKQDIWACGIILLELISGERKFPDFLLRKDEIIETYVRKLTL
jgi:calcium-dependent protein kinase